MSTRVAGRESGNGKNEFLFSLQFLSLQFSGNHPTTEQPPLIPFKYSENITDSFTHITIPKLLSNFYLLILILTLIS